jgi:hypothetical protein
MSDLLASGLLIDLIMIGVLFEAAALALLHRRRGLGFAPGRWLPTLAAGLCLMLALRAAVTGGGATLVLFWLAASGIAHALDLYLRRPPAS